jgi:membrane-bound metal-dependent hydrolase YbcI (DUF457 family)
MPSTFVHGLLPPSCLVVVKSKLPKMEKAQKYRLLLIAFFLGNAPDLDLIPASFDPTHWRLIHRAWGHNMFSLMCWITLGVFLITRFVSKDFKGKRAWLISTGLVLSHVVLDCMGQMDKAGHKPGIPLFFPLTRYEVTLPLNFFKSYSLDPKLNPIIAHAVSKTFWTDSVISEVATMVFLFLFWVVGFACLVGLQKLFTRKPETKSASPLTPESHDVEQAQVS